MTSTLRNPSPFQKRYDNSKKTFNYFMILCFILAFGNALLNMPAHAITSRFFNSTGYYTYNLFNIFNPLWGTHAHTFFYFLLGCFVRGNSEAINEKLSCYRFIT